ncbi:hypothetical protein SAMN04487898_103356 [Pedobacter sp. ok626]|uniref:hypothetical protein n=1 Tax=Pedobacter sp. ok626 TaxID=1761882 RepID=UPI00088409E5|nr:hypothetical protein [Pedobacter sp. ok626]SDJ59707.1 hypothetical protein SAMN04487898_103356 [Pedobacter sp. ok626]
MKNIIIPLLLIINSFQSEQAFIAVAKKLNPEQLDKSINKQDGLFILIKKNSEDFVRIIPPKNSKFELPDSSAKTEAFKYGDFNADGKKDILVYLGACGTGGCMYGLFLNQYKNYYKLAYLDYLKNVEFKIEKNGLWTIKSSEEIEPYNPSKIQITAYKFDKKTYQYKLDSKYLYEDKGGKQ